ncbi:MAG: prepilin-type N-terminal cleavage/methylation domain-containing protein [Candidatus Omnitrophica bacterium]|nr:prepilin-type N-terminal cleavage/methylation domain-containing protein [Candidatus Omnitrophota bacterium]
MKPPTRTMSSIGNKEKGFTFVEVMVALVILSAGIVMIYKSFFLYADYLSYLTCRLHATQMMESKIADIERSFRQSQGSSFDTGAMTETVKINHKRVDFNYTINTTSLLGLEGVYRMDITLAWHDGHRLMQLSRASLLTKI